MRPQTIVSMLMITPLLSWALNSAAQVPPTPTPTATPRLLVTAKLTQVSGHSVIACTVKDSSGHAVRSQTVSVQKAAAVTGPFADWMSKKTTVNGQALFPYAQPTYTWYVRCAAAWPARRTALPARFIVSATKTIKGKKPRPSPTATPRPTATATPKPTAHRDAHRHPTADGTPTPTVTPTATPSSSPFGGTPVKLPAMIEAEDFDNGGEGIAYHDDTPGNSGGAYRDSDVDIQDTSDVGGGYNLGWIASGEWLAYTINVQTAGLYKLEARVASAGHGGTFHVEFGSGVNSDELAIPDTGGWDTYQTIATNVQLNAGRQVMRTSCSIPTAAAGYADPGDLNWFNLTMAASTPTPSVDSHSNADTALRHDGHTEANGHSYAYGHCDRPGRRQPRQRLPLGPYTCSDCDGNAATESNGHCDPRPTVTPTATPGSQVEIDVPGLQRLDGPPKRRRRHLPDQYDGSGTHVQPQPERLHHGQQSPVQHVEPSADHDIQTQFNPYDYVALRLPTGGAGFRPRLLGQPSRLAVQHLQPLELLDQASYLGVAARITGRELNDVLIGTYVKQITNADSRSDEVGGNHYYHLHQPAQQRPVDPRHPQHAP